MKKESILIQRRGPKDRYGDFPDIGAPIAVPGCVVWPRTGESEDNRSEIIVDGQNVKIPWGKPYPEARDAVWLRDEEYEVVGVPGIYQGKAVIVVLEKVG